MRGGEPRELLKLIVELLEQQVLPTVPTSSARATLLLSVGLLDNLAERVQERAELVERRERRMAALISGAPAELQAVANAAPAKGQSTDELTGLLRAVFAEPALLDDASTAEWLQECQVVLRDQTRDDVALLNSTRYYRSLGA